MVRLPHRRLVTVAAALALAVPLALTPASLGPLGSTGGPAAAADPVPATVTSDVLPTVQVDGVVWRVQMAGDMVYAGGQFTRARPAGAALGTNDVARANLLRFDVRTGVLDAWAPNPDALVYAFAVSPDGRRLYVGGSFTTIAGQSRLRIAAFDTSTGQLVTSFNARTNSQVRAIVATDTTVYVGGIFTTANGQSRTRLAAFRASDGALLPWAPTVEDNRVNALAISPDRSVVVVGGGFTLVNGTTTASRGLARLDAASGAKLPFPANAVVANSGDRGAIYALAGDADSVYGVGYTHGRIGGTLEGAFAADWTQGNLRWVLDCHGDTYDVHPVGPVVYSVSHHHYCGNVRSVPQPQSWVYYRANAMTATATQRVNREFLGYYDFEGQQSPSVLQWYPELRAGSYTGQDQAAWALDGDSRYLVLGGEFPRVNNVAQQGLVRFAVPSVAPRKSGPRFSGSGWPDVTARPAGSGAVRVSWLTNSDPDSENLTYRVIRNGATASPVGEVVLPSQPWHRYWGGFTDTGLTPGATYTYQVRAADPDGNTAVSATVSVVAQSGTALSPYASAVLADGPMHYWRLGERSGTVMRDLASIDDAWRGTSSTIGQPGAIVGDPDTSLRSVSSTGSRVVGRLRWQNRFDYSLEAWFRAPSSSLGGHIVGLGSTDWLADSSKPGQRDRVIYMDSAGRLQFLLDVGELRTVRSPLSYRDNAWHHVVATVAQDGMRLYIDGALVGHRTDTSSGLNNYTGFWRIGDSISGFPNAGTATSFDGWLDEVAVYPYPMTASQIGGHNTLGRGGATTNRPPTAAFTSAATGLTVMLDGSASSDPDGTVTTWRWDLGDGTTLTGPQVQHTYTAAGSRTVTLTVTDDDGASATTSRVVTVSATVPGALARDTFTRAVTGGWGDAETGGAWSIAGTTSRFSVADGQGRHSLSGGSTTSSYLTGVSAPTADVTVSVGLDGLPGANSFLTVMGRRVGEAFYGGRLLVEADGDLQLHVVRGLGSTTTPVAGGVLGARTTPGQLWWVRVQVEGAAPSTIRTRAWPDGAPEPSLWHATYVDTTTGLQGPGGLGVRSYLGGTTPRVVTYDELTVRPVGG